MTEKKKKSLRPPRPHSRPDNGDAFFPDPQGGPARVSDDLAEELAEVFVGSATSGEGAGEEAHEQSVPEEKGGPFVPSSAEKEFGYDVDESNPVGATREPLPTTRSRPD